jgi:hypothetical protein
MLSPHGETARDYHSQKAKVESRAAGSQKVLSEQAAAMAATESSRDGADGK